MSYGAALDRSSRGRRRTWSTLTIPEGRSRREVAPTRRDAGCSGNYLAGQRATRGLDPRDYGAPRGRTSLEGFLFPATYELKRAARAQARRPSSSTRSSATSRKVDLRYARSKNLTPYDVLIIASMIEREAPVPKERKLIASVIYNRLHEGIPLGIDATIALRDRQLDRAAARCPSCRPRPRTTRASTRACRRGRSAARAWPRSRPPRTRRKTELPLLRGRSRAAAASTASRRTDAAVPARRRRLQPARARSAAASRRRVLTALAGVLGFPVGAQPLAGDDERRLRASSVSTGATCGCRSRRSASRRPRGAGAARASVGANVTIPHKLAALELADERDARGRARSAPRTR